VVEKLRIWLDKSLPEMAPKTTLGEALGYLGNGELPIANNAREHPARPFLIGRKAVVLPRASRAQKRARRFTA